MKRRQFIALFGGAAAAWPVAARAQQGQRERLVCILETVSVDTPSAKLRHPAFLEGLQQLGWTPGRNVRIEVRWGEGDEAATRKYAAELVALTPDVLVAGGGVAAEVLLKRTSADLKSTQTWRKDRARARPCQSDNVPKYSRR